jgi:hypothetical protein
MSDLLDLAYPVANYTTDHALARRGHHRQRSARLRKEGLPWHAVRARSSPGAGPAQKARNL